MYLYFFIYIDVLYFIFFNRYHTTMWSIILISDYKNFELEQIVYFVLYKSFKNIGNTKYEFKL